MFPFLGFIVACPLYKTQKLPKKVLINIDPLNKIDYITFFPSIISERISMGTGNTIVLLLSAAML